MVRWPTLSSSLTPSRAIRVASTADFPAATLPFAAMINPHCELTFCLASSRCSSTCWRRCDKVSMACRICAETLPA